MREATRSRGRLCVSPQNISLLICRHLIEPRFDEFQSAADKLASLTARKIELPSLAPFRKALGSTKLLAAGGFGPDNFATGIEDGSHDLVAMGRYFMCVIYPLQRESNANVQLQCRLGGPTAFRRTSVQMGPV